MATHSELDIPTKLRCASCNDLVGVEAFRLPCCEQSICVECQKSLPESCPVCAHSPLSAADCKPNKALRLTVKAFLKASEKRKEKAKADAALTPTAVAKDTVSREDVTSINASGAKANESEKQDQSQHAAKIPRDQEFSAQKDHRNEGERVESNQGQHSISNEETGAESPGRPASRSSPQKLQLQTSTGYESSVMPNGARPSSQHRGSPADFANMHWQASQGFNPYMQSMQMMSPMSNMSWGNMNSPMGMNGMNFGGMGMGSGMFNGFNNSYGSAHPMASMSNWSDYSYTPNPMMGQFQQGGYGGQWQAQRNFGNGSGYSGYNNYQSTGEYDQSEMRPVSIDSKNRVEQNGQSQKFSQRSQQNSDDYPNGSSHELSQRSPLRAHRDRRGSNGGDEDHLNANASGLDESTELTKNDWTNTSGKTSKASFEARDGSSVDLKSASQSQSPAGHQNSQSRHHEILDQMDEAVNPVAATKTTHYSNSANGAYSDAKSYGDYPVNTQPPVGAPTGPRAMRGAWPKDPVSDTRQYQTQRHSRQDTQTSFNTSRSENRGQQRRRATPNDDDKFYAQESRPGSRGSMKPAQYRSPTPDHESEHRIRQSQRNKEWRDDREMRRHRSRGPRHHYARERGDRQSRSVNSSQSPRRSHSRSGNRRHSQRHDRSRSRSYESVGRDRHRNRRERSSDSDHGHRRSHKERHKRRREDKRDDERRKRQRREPETDRTSYDEERGGRSDDRRARRRDEQYDQIESGFSYADEEARHEVEFKIKGSRAAKSHHDAKSYRPPSTFNPPAGPRGYRSQTSEGRLKEPPAAPVETSTDPHTLEREARNRERMLREEQRRASIMSKHLRTSTR